jgi:hypothetical protein
VCGTVFPVPASYSPAVDPAAGPATHPRKETAAVATDLLTDRPLPPPGFVPPAGLMPPEPYPQTAEGYEKTTGFTISPRVLEWIPAACFTLIFLLTFFTWCGMYPGGYKAYSQNAWQAAFGNFSSDYFSEEVLKMESDLAARVGMNFLLIPYLIGLILVVALAWFERFIGPATERIPVPQIQEYWKYRFAVIAGLGAVLLLLLAFQIRIGFGLESAARQRAAIAYEKEFEKAGDNSTARQKVYVKQGQELGGYGLQNTSWLALAIAAHVVALAAAAGKFLIDARGERPPPRVSLYW